MTIMTLLVSLRTWNLGIQPTVKHGHGPRSHILEGLGEGLESHSRFVSQSRKLNFTSTEDSYRARTQREDLATRGEVTNYCEIWPSYWSITQLLTDIQRTEGLANYLATSEPRKILGLCRFAISGAYSYVCTYIVWIGDSSQSKGPFASNFLEKPLEWTLPHNGQYLLH